MYNITLIGTIHWENGKCNPDELHKILEDINPEVIFDELPSSSFDMYYSESFDILYAYSILLSQHPPIVPLEVKCIKKIFKIIKLKFFPSILMKKKNYLNTKTRFFFC